MVINHILSEPKILPLFNLSYLPSYKKQGLENIKYIFQTILNGNLFEDKKEYCYTKLNYYCIRCTKK
jgi:hypothetical protein